jgi:hypothetical protein
MYVLHKLMNKDGRCIILPAWKGGQVGPTNLQVPDDIGDIDSIQKYPVGTKLLDNERVFYYAKASSVGVTKTDYGVKNGYRQAVAYANVAVAAAIGDRTLVIDVAGTDGNGKNGAIAANELAGGFVVIFGHDDDATVCRILENTATTGASEMTLTLQDKITATLVVDADQAECMAHWASGCEYNTNNEEPVVGVAHKKVTANYWFWLQTWGPCWLGPSSGGPCDGAHKHQVVFESTGEVDGHEYDSAILTEQQHAGFGLCHANANGQGAPFLMLQICP